MKTLCCALLMLASLTPITSSGAPLLLPEEADPELVKVLSITPDNDSGFRVEFVNANPGNELLIMYDGIFDSQHACRVIAFSSCTILMTRGEHRLVIWSVRDRSEEEKILSVPD